MKNTLLITVAAVAIGAFAADPKASNITFSQDAATRLVTVTYDLSGDGIVTLDILTNGVSIGVENIVTTAGDVNMLVSGGTGKSITWRPDYDWEGKFFNATAKLKVWKKNDPPDWLVASVCMVSNVQYYLCEAQIPWGITNDVYKTRKLLMRRIHAAGVPWNMGSISAENGRDSAREYIHTVTLTNDFYIGVYEYTQQQYQFITGTRPASSGYGGLDGDMNWYKYPASNVGTDTLRGSVAEGINWPQTGHAVKNGSFLDLLRSRTGIEFDLPVEAQWEFAARAGCPFGLYNGYNILSTKADAHLDEIAWWTSNCVRTAAGNLTTQPVGLKKPNAWKLYDMLGNTCETCLDYWAFDVRGCDPNVGLILETGSRNRRGGCSVNWEANTVRVNYRDVVVQAGRSEAGFRLAWTLYK